jgi:hypothetical protein
MRRKTFAATPAPAGTGPTGPAVAPVTFAVPGDTPYGHVAGQHPTDADRRR